MPDRDRDFLTRTESKKRSNKTQGRKKLDRLLNVLIAIVAVLIIINLYFVFSNNGELAKDNDAVVTEPTSDVAQNETGQAQSNSSEDKANGVDNNDSNNTKENNENKNNATTEQKDNETNKEENESQETSNTNNESEIIEVSTDPLVQNIIVNPNWQVTPTLQSGEHVSTYVDGDIDYEEKKLTIRNAVGLAEDNIIYWRINNNGSSETAIAVVSSMDKEQKYRVSIEWVANKGWKPVKVELLNAIEGA